MTDTWTERLSEYLDDDLSPADRAALEQHLTACDPCRATLGELRQVVARAAALTPRTPDTELWPGLEARLQAGSARVTPFRARPSWRVSFSLPQLVAASLALMVLSGGAVWIAQHGGRATSLPAAGASAAVPATALPVVFSDPRYDEAVADLEQALQDGRASLDPQTIKVLEQNLQAIDRAIEQSRAALQSDPANIYLNNHLAEARQRKLMLLRQATALTSTKG